ncbi:cytochrome c oxidase subunit 7A, mitochondrial [Cryptotermes secundus]|uniref:cytochrome c oxidase subunit 7A, mitochondrial n=1 Tax=Cryptotermes secundus TaxID=105785 RepID=UPI000CD7C258|nr:cytochrome c oxidase subunit 7A, mitochondrial [Cryptotermes secundus]
MNSAKKVLQLGQLGARHISMSQAPMSAEKQAANYAKLKAKQAKFQVDDGQLVYLKGGVVDRLLYQFTVALCVIGLGLSGKVLYELSYPKKA